MRDVDFSVGISRYLFDCVLLRLRLRATGFVAGSPDYPKSGWGHEDGKSRASAEKIEC